MNFLSLHIIKKLAYRKGFTAEKRGVVKGLTYVRLIDPDGIEREGRFNKAFNLADAEAYLTKMPDRIAKTSATSKVGYF